MSECRTDAWLSAALDPMEFLPHQLVVKVSRELPVTYELNKSVNTEQCKLLLFDALGKHYGQPDCSPLLGDYMGDVCTVLIELLGEFALVCLLYESFSE